MLNLLNKSVKTINNGLTTIVNGITTENSYKTEVDFCKFDKLNLNFLSFTEKEKEISAFNTSATTNNNTASLEPDQNLKEFNVLYIVHSKVHLNIFNLTDELDLKCIIMTKFTFPINSVDTLYLPYSTTYTKELPIVALVSNYSPYQETPSKITNNSNLLTQKNESNLKFFSIKSKRVVHNLRFKKKILQFISKLKFFAVSFADGDIKLFNNKFENFFTIKTNEAISGNFINDTINNDVDNSNSKEVNNKCTVPKTNSNKISNSLLSSSLSSNFSLNNIQNKTGVIKSEVNNNNNCSNLYSLPIFDLTDSYILYCCDGPASTSRENLDNNNYNNNVIIDHDSDSNKKVSSHKIKMNNNFNIGVYNIKNESSPKKTTENINFNNFNNYNSYITTTNGTSIENIASEVYNQVSKLKDWSVTQFKDYSNLRNASNISNSNTPSLKKRSNNCKLILQKINLEENITNCVVKEEREGRDRESNRNIKSDKKEAIISSVTENTVNNFNSNITPPYYHINVPFFEEGISLIKFFNEGRYFIIGNKNSQMFYLYELFPQSNLKYTTETDSLNMNNFSTNSIYNFKISHSLYRGVTSAVINSLDLSQCKNFSVIASNKGTFHLFHLPKRDNQILENTSNFDYNNFDEVNHKVVCAKDVDKLKMGNFLSNYTYKTTCKIVNYNKIDVEKNFTYEMSEELLKSKFSQTRKGNVLFTFSENDPAVHVYFLNKKSNNSKSNHNVYLMKKLEVNFEYNSGEVEKNFNDLIKRGKMLNNAGNKLIANIGKMKSIFKDYIELNTTDKNFPDLHTNPLFTFNIMKNTKDIANMNMKRINSNTNVNYSSNSNKNSKLQMNTKIIEEKNESDFSPSTSFSGKVNKTNNENNNNSKSFEFKPKCLANVNYSSYKIERVINFLISSPNSQNVKKLSYPNFKSRSNSSNIKIASNKDNNLNNNLFINDINVHEKLLCQELEYTQKSFFPDKKIFQKNDFVIENYLQPKLIVCPTSGYIHHTKMKKTLHKINSSISDNSSSVENSISLTGININNEIAINDSENINKESNYNKDCFTTTNFSNENNNNDTFYQNRDLMLKNQLRKDIESDLVDSLNKNNEIVKVIRNFNFDDDYLVNKK